MEKNKNISARVTENEYNEIIKLAKKRNNKISDYIVNCCLSQQQNQNCMQTTAIIIDIKKILRKLDNGIIKKSECIQKIKEVLSQDGTF